MAKDSDEAADRPWNGDKAGWIEAEKLLDRKAGPTDIPGSAWRPSGSTEEKKRACRFFRWHNTFSESRWIHTCGFSHCQRHREKQAGARPTVSRGFLHLTDH